MGVENTLTAIATGGRWQLHAGWGVIGIDERKGVAAVMGIKMNLFKRRLVCATVAALSFAVLEGVSLAVDTQIEELAQRAGIAVIGDATSDQAVLDYTKARIPFSKMSQVAQKRAGIILSDVSQFRRMPSLQYEVDTNMYQYLINHPDVSVSTWRAMGISTLKMWQTDRFEYEAQAADGSEGIADVLWRDENQCLFIVEGKYNSPILPASIQASALVWLQYRFVTRKDGKQVVNQQVETFVHFPSAAIDTLAKLASRVTNTILDRNVFEVSLYARMMSQAVERDPDWIAQLASQLDGVPPQRRKELILVANSKGPNFEAMSMSGVSNQASQPAGSGGPVIIRPDNMPIAAAGSSLVSQNVGRSTTVMILPPGTASGMSQAAKSSVPVNSKNTRSAAITQSLPTKGAAATANVVARPVAEYKFYSPTSASDGETTDSAACPQAPTMHGPTRSVVDGLLPTGTPTAFSEAPGADVKHRKAAGSASAHPQVVTLPQASELRFGDGKASSSKRAAKTQAISVSSAEESASIGQLIAD
ncbi:MAG: hypothetical protein WAO83_10675 [Fuerstiella sp.]